MAGRWRTKSVEQSIADTDEEGTRLRKDLSWWDLTVFGVSVVIGAGIFTITASTAGNITGPAISISFVIAAIACGLAALCYAEFASTVPVAGSAYTFSYATFGEFVAWIIGWDLILEFAVAAAVVAKGWSSYLGTVFGFSGGTADFGPVQLDWGALLIIAFVTAVLAWGTKLSAEVSLAITAIKVSVVLLVVVVGSFYIKTVLYVAVAVVLTGMVHFTELRAAGDKANLATAFVANGVDWAAKVISIGALAGLTTVVIVLVLGQTRVLFAMCRDGLLPRPLARTGRHGTPVRITIIVGVLVALAASVFPMDKLEEMVNIGTLFAFVLVSAGVVVLRRTRPDLPRGFRAPWVPALPIAAIVACVWLMLNLTGLTWIRFVVWMAVGIVVYFAYGRSHSMLARRAAASAAPR
jgi:amino acid transporter